MISVILQSWKGLKPQDKVVYLHWIWCTREQRNVFLSIASLAEKLKIKESTVRGSVARLCMCDKVISNDEQSSYAVAYPAGFDSAQAQSEEKLASILAMLGIGTALIGERAEVLAKRLLRAVLVSLTDDLGIIERVSFSHLSSITGMTVQRLRRYKDELIDDGYIIKFLPGGNAPSLYKKVASICIMNPEKFTGKNIALWRFEAESLVSNRELNSCIHNIQTKYQSTPVLNIEEINRHRLAGRVHHLFDEFVSQAIRSKLLEKYLICSRDIIAKTDQITVNKRLQILWRRHIESVSGVVVEILLEHIGESGPEYPIDVYFFRHKDTCYVLSNVGLSECGSTN
ncbi:hypothetical protein CGJ43_13770 [Vibrio parahaemolyticus]|uniref:hypothetical protein n=1 Tax=Vibrio parahaemolyticus TaxID=670 RepID=UPI0011218B8B|nr:hypothetical protein [Vibrio parahaemolyticus]MBE3816769.1 hypothetical protein [Vibrio parahaemolyticus]MBE3884509.1 hypothetical protein [Vibrio parahaemolyticus]MBE4177743.1 hypothetical protein [Vibrio parahaemolyticus]MBE4281764.1 hypothetical protein [Vibrio parahaemolyticus]MDG2565065.1 hypothetical protein [Vibrio parahaemolyticus]